MYFFGCKNRIVYFILICVSNVFCPPQAQSRDISICDTVGYYNCDANYDCHFDIGAGNGKCINLDKMAKPWQYNCTIKNLVVGNIATLGYGDAEAQGIKVYYLGDSFRDFTVNTQQAKINLSHLHITVETPGDYTTSDAILHCDRSLF